MPTPISDRENSVPQPNIDSVLEVVRGISSLLKAQDLLILESTCPVGTTEKISNLLIELDVDVNDLSIAYCPERVLPGRF